MLFKSTQTRVQQVTRHVTIIKMDAWKFSSNYVRILYLSIIYNNIQIAKLYGEALNTDTITRNFKYDSMTYIRYIHSLYLLFCPIENTSKLINLESIQYRYS